MEKLAQRNAMPADAILANDSSQAVTEKINSFLDNVVKFEVLETFARGPTVFNERIDHFQNLNIKSWRGVGVFFLRDGKIVEWYDYTITAERA